MTSNAIETQGTTFSIGNGDSPLTYTAVGDIVSFTAFDGAAAEIDITNLSSTAKEFLMGLQDFGTVSLDVNYVPDDTGQDALRTAKTNRTLTDFKFTLSNADEITFQGFVMSFTMNGGVDSKLEGSVSVRISGDVTGL